MVGCASKKATKNKPRTNIDEEAKPYVRHFERIYGEKIPDNVTVRIVEIEGYPNAGGVCNRISKRIRLNKSRWDKFTKATKLMVVLHELGHCVLDRPHVYFNERRFDCAPSLMGRKGASDKCFRKHYDYYINELFTGCRRKNIKRLTK